MITVQYWDHEDPLETNSDVLVVPAYTSGSYGNQGSLLRRALTKYDSIGLGRQYDRLVSQTGQFNPGAVATMRVPQRGTGPQWVFLAATQYSPVSDLYRMVVKATTANIIKAMKDIKEATASVAIPRFSVASGPTRGLGVAEELGWIVWGFGEGFGAAGRRYEINLYSCGEPPDTDIDDDEFFKTAALKALVA